MEERLIFMENQEGETGNDGWIVEAKKQREDIRINAEKAAQVNPRVVATKGHGLIWQQAWQEAFNRYYELGLKSFAKGNPGDAKRYARDWDQFIQAHPEVANLSRVQLNTWLIDNNTPIKQADALIVSRDIARGVQMAEQEVEQRGQRETTGGGVGQPPGEGPPAPPAGPPGPEGEIPGTPEERPPEPTNRVLEDAFTAAFIPSYLTAMIIAFRNSSEQNRQLFDQNPETFTEEFKHVARQRALESAREETMREVEQARMREVKQRGPEKIVSKTQYGTEVTYSWPDTLDGKLQELRSILTSIEASPYADGGDINRSDLTELSLVINTLMTSRDPEKKSQGERMYKELIPRLYIHAAFLEYSTKANDVDTVMGIVSNLRADHLNYVFRDMPLVWKAFVYYEQHSRDYLSARGDEIKRFAESVRNIFGPEVSEVDRISAQVIAERLWQLTGRRVIRDELVRKDYPDRLATKEDKEGGDVGFIGEANYGNFSMRRVLNFNNWLYTRVKTDRPLLQLMKGVDLKSGDFLSGLPSQIEEQYVHILYNKYRGEVKEIKDTEGKVKNTNEADDKGNFIYAKSKAEEDAHEITQILTGVRDKEKVKIVNGREEVDKDEITGRSKCEWIREDGRYIDVTGIKWRQGDLSDKDKSRLLELLGEIPEMSFDIFGDQPMSYWAYIEASQPEKVRDALMGKTVGFLRKPTSESLNALVDLFAYQRDGQYKLKGQLASNFIDFLRSEQTGRLGYIKPDRMMIDSIIGVTAYNLGLSPKEAQEMAQEKLGDNIIANLILGLSYFKADRFLFSFILELLKGILQQSVSIK